MIDRVRVDEANRLKEERPLRHVVERALAVTAQPRKRPGWATGELDRSAGCRPDDGVRDESHAEGTVAAD